MKIIAIEGIDGSGKTTFCKELTRYLSNYTESFQTISKNISKRPLRVIYKELISSISFPSPELSLLLGMADFKYVEEFILDNKKEFIILDRCFISNLVDCMSLGINIFNSFEFIISLFKIPDIIFFMDIDSTVASARKGKDISVAECGGPYSDANINDAFIKFQHNNYTNYSILFNKIANITNIIKVTENDSVSEVIDNSGLLLTK
jgi:thymidylate kinase